MFRIGLGIDQHLLLMQNNPTHLYLGGCQIATNYKVDAHSDGDVLLHAISSAFLGALSLPDLGHYFPDQTTKTKNLASAVILGKTYSLVLEHGYLIGNIDITLVCELIYFKPFAPMIKNHLTKLLKTPNISLKATRFEQESALLKCYATVLLVKKNLVNFGNIN